MAKPNDFLFFYVFLVLLIGWDAEAEASDIQNRHHHRHRLHHHFPQKLFVFGDSYADTGNYRKGEAGSWTVPYGITFPGKPAGRFSDGRVLTDFLAFFVGLRSPIPYRWREIKPERQKHGINFAYGGTGVFDTPNLRPNMTTQIDFFQSLVNEGLYSRQDLSSCLAFVSVAGNDYTAYEANNGTVEGLPSFTQSLIKQFHVDLQRLCDLGVRKITVTAIEPLGCLPAKTANLSFRECNEVFNKAAVFHNQLLQEAVQQLNKQNNGSTVVLLDLYDAFMAVLEGRDRPGGLKFEKPLEPCCLGTSAGADCGSVGDKGEMKYKVCDDPESSFFWDPVHPSQMGWAAVTASLHGTLQTLYR